MSINTTKHTALLEYARDLIEGHEIEYARNLVSRLLTDDPDDWRHLHLQACIERESERHGLSLALWKLSLQQALLAGSNPPDMVLSGIAGALHLMWRDDEALDVAKQAILANPNCPEHWITLAACYLHLCDAENCERAANKILGLHPDYEIVKENLFQAQLIQRRWLEGWTNAEQLLGSVTRMKTEYTFTDTEGHTKSTSWWEGQKDGIVAISGEQGLGDEIMFASVIPDVMRDSEKVIIDCEQKLQGLFKRSFPDALVYGTRREAQPTWAIAPDFTTSFGTIPKFYRTADEHFDGNQYLTPCPIRSEQWRTFFEKIDKPIIGIAWTGGRTITGKTVRDIDINLWAKILKLDCHFVNLEYVDQRLELLESKYGDRVHTYPWATMTDDYDDTAALVSQLDLVISVPTTVVHLAGALGVPTLCMVPEWYNWRFAPMPDVDGEERLLWSKSVRLIRQKSKGEWVPTINKVARLLREEYSC